MAKQLINAVQLEELRAALRDVGDDIGDLALSLLEEIASGVVADARSHVPQRTGRARATYRLRGTAIVFGDDSAPYVPWLEFGGKVGRHNSNLRAYNPQGRYVYPSIARNMADVERRVDDLISQITAGFLTVEGS